MLCSICHNLTDCIKKRVVIFQPSLGVTQVRIYFVRRNQAGHGLASFGNKDMFFAKGHLA